MDFASIIQTSILTPLTLFFILGLIAARIKSDLKIPEPVTTILSIYLLAAIGLHGGMEMKKAGLETLVLPILVAVGLGVITTMNHYQILRRLGKFSISDSSALAATYGSVSVATFSVALSFLKSQGITSEGYLAAILAVLEPTGLITGIILGNIAISKSRKQKLSTISAQTNNSKADSVKISPDQIRGNLLYDAIEGTEARDQIPKISGILKETVTGKAVFILLGSIVIGYLIGEAGFHSIKPVFEDAFKGALVIYLIEMGIIAAQRLDEIKKVGPFLIGFAILIPTLNGIIGVIISYFIGMSLGGSVVFGLLIASASYIAAPAVLRTAMPKANPSLYITSALGITFPYNVIVNLPVLFIIATALHDQSLVTSLGMDWVMLK